MFAKFTGCSFCFFTQECKYLRLIFNIKSALPIHQSPNLSQKIDSREGLFWCKMGLDVNAGKMNIYFKEPSFAPCFGLFAAKRSAFWC